MDFIIELMENMTITDVSAVSAVSAVSIPKKVSTEDTGKMFEMGLCLAYGTPYDGKYKYSMELPEKLKPRLAKALDLFPLCEHTAKKGARYDFTAINDDTKHLSAKTAKKGIGKVAPQVIGQSRPKKFCELIGVEYTTDANLKEYIQTHIKSILPILVSYTFDCPNIYYKQKEDTIRFITLNKLVEWDKYNFVWSRDYTEWGNSATLKIVLEKKEIALIEFQFHTKSRNNMAIRWCYDNFLTIFNDHLTIINI